MYNIPFYVLPLLRTLNTYNVNITYQNLYLIVSNTENMISFDPLFHIVLIKQQTKNLINNLTQGPTPPNRICIHWELYNFFYRLHLVVGTFSIEFGSINDDV